MHASLGFGDHTPSPEQTAVRFVSLRSDCSTGLLLQVNVTSVPSSVDAKGKMWPYCGVDSGPQFTIINTIMLLFLSGVMPVKGGNKS